MRKYYILLVVLVIGFAIVAAALFFVSKSPAPTADVPSSPQGFFSFFGRQLGFGDEPTTPGSEQPGVSVDETRPAFRQRLAREGMIAVSNDFISGITFTASTTATTTSAGLLATTTLESARFVDRKTGNIYDFSLETGDTKRLTNTTIPRIQEALFGVNGSAVALRYLADDNETIETYLAPLSTDLYASSTELVGSFLQQNIPSLAWSPTGAELSYVTITNTGATGRIANANGTNARVIFSSPLTEWNIAWKTPDALLFTTNPSHYAPGTIARVTPTGGKTHLLSGTRGLTALANPSGSRIVYSFSDGSATKLFVYDAGSRESTALALTTLPEKCVWANDDNIICAIPNTLYEKLPDAWYQNTVSFTDTFWMIDTATGLVTFLFDPQETSAGEDIDATQLSLSHDNTVLSFINKKDLRGWVADLSEWF
ncbi:MAG: hypothetical protein KBD16_00560 [Candidatus Pacebacteria bacterium]|nr:hypothetical protein [Candidatus Paceibacterota bacterium]